MKILLLSAYDADSHKYWREGLVANLPEHQWTVLTLPGRYFSWRIRGNSMSWAFGEHAATLAAHYDLVIATSMTDLSALRGFVPSLGKIPTIVYFHENQFAYPATAKARPNVEPQILNVYTALCGDNIVFNSHYNYQSFIDGATALFKKLPDQVPADALVQLKSRSQVLAVPLNDEQKQSNVTTAWDRYQDQCISRRPLLIAWAARWEYDKGPDRLLAIVELLIAKEIDFRICIMGQRFRQVPAEFERLSQRYSQYIDQFGYTNSRCEYMSWLKNADLFLSTAVHEFQGLAVLEALTQGCIPILPKRLVYPELFAQQYLYNSDDNVQFEAKMAVSLMLQQRLSLQSAPADPLAVPQKWQQLRAQYQALINATTQITP